MTNLTTKTPAELLTTLTHIEHQVRNPSGYAHDPAALERQWRQVSRELDSRTEDAR